MNQQNTIRICFIIFLFSLFANSPVQGQWKILKKFVQKDITILKESSECLVLYNQALQDSVVLAQTPKVECDIYASTEQKHGSNPYRIWVATEKFWKNPKLPKKLWGKFFKTSFLKLLRPPNEQVKSVQ